MGTTSPARINDDLFASARLAGEVLSRSASQQVVHWARIGREIEASASISQKDIAEVLAGSREYDTLNAKEQAVVRAEWQARMDSLRGALNFAEEFTAAGRTWVELDRHGDVAVRSSGAAMVRASRDPKRVKNESPVAKEFSGGGRRVSAKGVATANVVVKNPKTGKAVKGVPIKTSKSTKSTKTTKTTKTTKSSKSSKTVAHQRAVAGRANRVRASS